MRPDDNWRETRATAEDISQLLGVPVSMTEEFLLVLEDLIIHRLVEQLSDEDFTGKDVSIELPYLGTLVVSINDKGQVGLSFVARNTLYRKIKTACNRRESPLNDHVGKLLGDYLSQKMEGGVVDDK